MRSGLPDDSFDDLKRRAAFNRQDAGRLTHWIRAAHAISAKTQLANPTTPELPFFV